MKQRPLKARAEVVQLWCGLLLGPMAVLIQLQVNYALVLWACSHGSEWPLHLVALLALMITVIAGILSLMNWIFLKPKGAEDGGDVFSRSRFMAAVGILISALMFLAVIAQWIPVFIYGPCQRWM